MESSAGRRKSGVLNSEVDLEYIRTYIHTCMYSVNTVDFEFL